MSTQISPFSKVSLYYTSKSVWYLNKKIFMLSVFYFRLWASWEQEVTYTTNIYDSRSAAAAAKSPQSCPTLCDPIDGSPPGFPVPGILQARPLEWVAISFSNAWKWKVKVKMLSRVWLLVTPWTTAYQAPLSMGFSRQEYWSGVPLPSLTVALAHCKHFRNTG